MEPSTHQGGHRRRVANGHMGEAVGPCRPGCAVEEDNVRMAKISINKEGQNEPSLKWRWTSRATVGVLVGDA